MVHGDNIYLRELQNFFFEVLGMMSITHYGAVGDGRTDNYGPLQVAIDDAHRRGLSFLYVPFGRFIYTGELINIGDIIFMGNPHAHIINVRTGEEIEIHQFGWFNGDGNYYTKTEADGKFVDIAGDTMTGPLAIGSNSVTSGTLSFAQGFATASGEYSHAEGYGTTASAFNAHAEGYQSTASGNTSHAEGDGCVASGITSHAECSHTTASGHRSHAEGYQTTSSGENSHSEGHQTTASGGTSHAEGSTTESRGHRSHAEGWGSVTSNGQAHAEGLFTVAQGRSQHTEGEANIIDTTTTENSDARGTYLHIAGNGSVASGGQVQSRSNAYTLDWSGNGWFAGDVYVGSTSGTNKDAGSKKLATEEYVDTHGGSKSIITGVLNEDYEATSDTNYPIPLTLSESSGTGISIVNNGITIGTGVSKVKISGIANIYADTAGASKLSLYSDNTKVFEISITMSASSKGTIVIPTYVLPVTNGTALYMQLSMANGDIVYADTTWLTVEEV